jgi:hypothetical protein
MRFNPFFNSNSHLLAGTRRATPETPAGTRGLIRLESCLSFLLVYLAITSPSQIAAQQTPGTEPDEGSTGTAVASADITAEGLPTPPDLSAGPMQVDTDQIRSWGDRISPSDDVESQALLSRTEVTIRGDGSREIRHWNISKLLTRDAVRQAIRFESGWSPWHSDRPVISARLIQPDGKVVQIDASRAIEQSDGGDSGDTIDDTRRLVLLLPGLKIGSIVETLEVVQHRPSLENSFVASYWLPGFVPLELSQLQIKAEEGVAFHWETPGWDLSPTQLTPFPNTSADDRLASQITFELQQAKDIFAYWQSDNGPDRSQAPLVRIGLPGTWRDISTSYHALLAPKIDEASSIAALMVSDIDQNATTREIVDACVKRLRETIVYTGVEFGINRIVPYAAEEIIARGFGDCKDQSMMLIAMLRECGIVARAVMLESGYGLDVSPQMPAISNFNHMIVKIEGEEPTWVDPTAVGFPCGILPDSCCGRRGLVIDTQTEDLILIPARRPTDDVFDSVTTYAIDSSGYGTQSETTTYQNYAMVRILNGGPMDPSDEELNTYIATLFQLTPEQIDCRRPQDAPNTLIVESKYAPAQIAAWDGFQSAIQIDLRSILGDIPAILLQNPASEQDQTEDSDTDSVIPRLHPVVVSTSYRESRTLAFSYPSFLDSRLDFATKESKLGPVSIETTTTKRPDPREGYSVIEVCAKVILNADSAEISVDQLEEIQTQLAQLAGSESRLIGTLSLIDPTRSASADGGAAKDLLHWTDRYHTYPEDAANTIELARRLTIYGFPDSGRALALEAVERSPGNPTVLPLAHEMMLQGNNGENFQEGFEHAVCQDLLDLYQQNYPDDYLNINFSRVLMITAAGFCEMDRDQCQRLLDIAIPIIRDAAIDVNTRKVALAKAQLVLLRMGQEEQVVPLQQLFPQPSGLLGYVFQWFETPRSAEGFKRWVEGYRRGAAADDVAGLLIETQLIFCGSGRFDLLESWTRLAIEAGYGDATILKPERIAAAVEPRDCDHVDLSNRHQVVRAGVSALLCGEQDFLYLPCETADLQRSEVDYGNQTLVRLLGGGKILWAPDAIIETVWRLDWESDTPALGGHLMRFNPLVASDLQESIYVVPWDDNQWRWFFADDSIAMARWAKKLLDQGKTDLATEALQTLIDGSEPLPWFDQFRGSPAVRCWSTLSQLGDEGIGMTLDLFLIELRADLDSVSPDRFRSLSEQSDYSRIKIPLMVSLASYYRQTDNPEAEFEVLRSLIVDYPNTPDLLVPMANAATRADRLEEFEQTRNLVRSAQSELIAIQFEFISLVRRGLIDQAIEYFDNRVDGSQPFAEGFANSMTWQAMLQHAPDDQLRECVSRLTNAINGESTAPIHHTLTIALSMLDDPDSSFESLYIAADGYPFDDPNMAIARCMFLESVGLSDLAAEIYDKVVAEHPTSESVLLVARWFEQPE